MTSAQPSSLPDSDVHLVPPAAVSLILSAMTIYGASITNQTTISEGKVVGGSFVILSLAVVHTVSPGLADTFALLLFVVIFLTYGLRILQAIGISASGGS